MAGIIVFRSGHASYMVKMHYYFRRFPLNKDHKNEYTNKNQGMVYQNRNFMAPGAEALAKTHYFFKNHVLYSYLRVWSYW